MIVGITGKMGSGKSTVAAMIIENSTNRTWKIVPFAAPLKSLAKEYFMWDGIKDERGRLLLQELGATARHYVPSFWVHKWYESIKKHKHVIVDDLRYDNEAQAIKDLGGCIVKVLGRGNNDKHESEKGINDKYVDITIHNILDLRELNNKVITLLVEFLY